MKSKNFTLIFFMVMLFALPYLVSAQPPYVRLQATSPGTMDIGNVNISELGRFRGLYVNNPGYNFVTIGIPDFASYVYGLSVEQNFASSTFDVYGVRSVAGNSSTRSVYGGYFGTLTPGTGVHYGLYAAGSGSSGSSTYGIRGYSSNASSGAVYGGYLATTSSGTGIHYGLYAAGYSGSSSTATTYGVKGYGSSAGSGPVYGGYFETTTSGTGPHYGLGVYGYGNSTSYTWGVQASGTNSGSGRALGGVFFTGTNGTGSHTGLSGSGYANSAAETRGVEGYGQNLGSGIVYGGFFSANAAGTGVHYGVYGLETRGGTGAAVYAAGDFAASGTKSAVVKTSSGHRLFYSQESTENWFEDFGQSQLANGKAYVELDPDFLEAVTISSEHPMKVFVQITSEEPMNVLIRKGATGFEVIAESKTSAATFDYRIVAKRKGYENDRMQKTKVGYDDPNLYPELLNEIEKRYQEEQEQNKLNQESQEQEQQMQKSECEQHEQELQNQESENELFKPESIMDDANHSTLINWNELPDASLTSNYMNDPSIPQANSLNQNQPNPFNPTTVIQFDVMQAGLVQLKIYNTLGQEVATLVNQNMPAGRHSAIFNASDLPSGTYFSQLSINGVQKVKKMQLIK